MEWKKNKAQPEQQPKRMLKQMQERKSDIYTERERESMSVCVEGPEGNITSQAASMHETKK